MRFSKLRKLSRHVAGVPGKRVSISRQNFFRGQVQCHARASRQNRRQGVFCPCMYFSRHVTCPPRLEDTASVGGLQPVLMVHYPYHLNRSFKLTKRWLPMTRGSTSSMSNCWPPPPNCSLT